MRIKWPSYTDMTLSLAAGENGPEQSSKIQTQHRELRDIHEMNLSATLEALAIFFVANATGARGEAMYNHQLVFSPKKG